MEEQPTETRTAPVGSYVELIGKIALGLAAAAYVLGLLIVNLYLSKLGVVDSQLVRADYAMVGATWLMLFVGGCLPFLAFVAPLSKAFKDRKGWIAAAIYSVIGGSAALCLLAVVIAALSGDAASIFLAQTWRMLATALFMPAFAIVSLTVFWPLTRRVIVERSDLTYRVMFALQFTLGTGGVLVASLPAYARITYPAIQRAYGGAAPCGVMVNLRHDALGDLDSDTRTRLMVANNRCVLVAESDKWLILELLPIARNGTRRMIRIRRDDVLTVVSTDG